MTGGRELSALRVLVRAGVLRPASPIRAVAAAAALRRCGPTLAAAVAANARLDPDAPALSDPDGTLSYTDLARAGDQVATALGRLGAGPDATIGLMGRNHRHFATALLGAIRIGADVVLLPTSTPAALVAAIRARHAIDLVLHDPGLAAAAGRAGPPGGRGVGPPRGRGRAPPAGRGAGGTWACRRRAGWAGRRGPAGSCSSHRVRRANRARRYERREPQMWPTSGSA